MTLINPERKVRRETSTLHRGRPIVVELDVFGLTLRQKGKRKSFLLPYDAALDLAMKLEARKVMAEKAAQRQARRRNTFDAAGIWKIKTRRGR
jgi:hypothetical protein